MMGIIEIDSERGRQLGFTSDRFTRDSYLWEEPERIMVSLIRSRKPGSFRALVAAILADGKSVAVPTPVGDMRRIVQKNGYVHTVECAGPTETLDNLRARIRELEAENARLNMEMAAYRQGCMKEDAAAMLAVKDALYAEKQARAEVGRCDCGASYYRIEQVGQQCEIQYCRGIVKSTTADREGEP